MVTRSAMHVSLAFLLFALVAPAYASMRCAKGLVSEGETSSEVLRKCGEPAQREVFQPGETAKEGAATVERWVYGPDNGMYRYLRFIDGVLVQIMSQRG